MQKGEIPSLDALVCEEGEALSSCHFLPTREELETCDRYSLKALKRAYLILFFIYAVAASVIALIVGSWHFAFGAAFGALLLAAFAFGNYRIGRNGIRQNTEKLLQLSASYTYEFYEYHMLISVARGDSVTRLQKVFYADIARIEEVGNLLRLQIGSEIFLLRKADLPENSPLLTKKEESVAMTAAQKQKATEGLRLIFILMSVGAVSVAFSLVESFIYSTTPTLFPFYWWFFLLLPVPLFSLLYGVHLKKQGGKGLLNILSGAIFGGILLVFGILSLLNPADFDPHTYTAEHLELTEATVGVDLPEGGHCKTKYSYEYWQYAFTTVTYSDEEVAEFEKSLPSLPVWNSADPLELWDLIPASHYGAEFDYWFLYNADTGEFNTSSPEEGEFRYFSVGYNKNENLLSIVEYDISFSIPE